MSTKANKTVKIALFMMFATLFSRFVGFIKEMLIGSAYGTSIQADAYILAITIPTILFSSVVTAISTSYIPIYSEIKVKEGKNKCIYFTNNIINIIILLSVILTILGVVFSDQIISLIASGSGEATKSLASDLSKITFFSIIFIGVSQILIGFSQSNESFIIPSIINVPNSIIIILVVIFGKKFGIYGLVWGTLLGSIAQIIFQIPGIKKNGFNYLPIVDLKDKYLHRMLKDTIPILIGTAIQQFATLIDKVIAAGLIVGSIAALNYSMKITGFVFGITSMCIATIIFPILSNYKQTNNSKFNDVIIKGLNIVTITTIPLLVIIIIFNIPIVKILFQRGVFDYKATIMTAQALLAYSIGMLFFGYRDILNKVFYSLNDTKTPMINSAIALIFNIIASVILSKYVGHFGIALGTSIAAIITTILLFRSFN